MSTSVAPIIDQENSMAQLGAKTKTKSHVGLGVRSSNGASQGLAVHAQKKFSKTTGMSHIKPRSFGDISNRVGQMNDSAHGSAVKKVQKPSIIVPSVPHFNMHNTIQEPEPEFFPEIHEEEDYSDIFPASMHLSDQHISKLVRFWEVCRKPDMASLSPSKIPSSPPKSLSLMTPMREPEKPVVLEPILDEMFDLPPPSWE